MTATTIRESISTALADAKAHDDKRRAATLRLISAAIRDRDVANRSAGRDPVSDDDVLKILAKMVHQRVEAAREYEEAGRIELAEKERAEIGVINELMPAQLEPGEMEKACRQAVEDSDAKSLRDVGRCMNKIKQRYPGRVDLGKASTVVKGLLR